MMPPVSNDDKHGPAACKPSACLLSQRTSQACRPYQHYWLCRQASTALSSPWLQVHVGWLPGGTAVMAFRGTENAHDGLQDMKIIRKNIDYLQEMYPGVQAHTGEQVVRSAGGSLNSY